MENHPFTPPPFLGSGFRQNHQIRSLKTNSYPVLPSHRSLLPSSSHTSPAVSLLTTRGTALGPSFSRTNLTSHRRKHLRRCYDLLHLSIQRRELGLARRFLRVILGAHEWTTDEGFRLSLLLLALSWEEGEGGEGAGVTGGGKVGFLQMLDLNSSSTLKATHITPSLIEEYIAQARLSDAIELLEERVNVHPYKSQPELHCVLGMLYVFVGVQTLLNNNPSSSAGGEEREEMGVELRKLERTTRNKARLCFESAIQASESWIRTETLKRQRVWGVRKREAQLDANKLEKRGVLWGLDPLGGGESWPTKEHPDLAKIRRRLEGAGVDDEVEERDGGSGADSEGESSVSGSVYSLSSDEAESEGERRGRTRTRTRSRSHTAQHVPNPSSPPPPTAQEEEEEGEEQEPTPKHGPRAWSKAWPEVAAIWTPHPPPSVILARQFLSLLAPTTHASQSQSAARKRKLGRAVEMNSPFFTDGEGEGEEEGGEGGGGGGVVDGVQLTRDEAEQRLRRILFEGEDEDGESGRERGEGGSRVRERERVMGLKEERERQSREELRRRKEAKRRRRQHEDEGRSRSKKDRRDPL